MEKVVDLFKSFRNKEIEYDELFGALTKMLSEDPHFSGQAVATLDKAQQQTPIPVTDFINLRANVENTAATFHQQETSHGPADSEATMIFAGEEASAGPGDPTLMASSSPAPIAAEKRPAPTPIPEDDYADEATVIMPMAPRQSSAPIPEATPIPAKPPRSTTANEEGEHATLIATPPPSSEPTPVPVSPAEPYSPEPPISSPEPIPAEPVQTKITTKKPPFVLIGAGAAALLIIVLVVALWPTSDEAEPPTTALEDPTTQQESSPWGQEVPAEVLEPQINTVEETASTPESFEADTIDIDTAEEPFETPSEETLEELSTELSIETIELEEQPQEPIVKDEAYFMTAIQNAVDGGNLSPAEEEGTATYFLVELIKFNKESEKVSEARTLISKKHLELAKESRSNNQWDAAQKHLDDALKVRLPDSYLPE